MKKLTTVILAFSCLMLMSAGGVSAGQDAITMGALYPISGNLALMGEESWRGAEVARILRNRQGGIAGKQIVFRQGDASTNSAARSETERMIEQDKVKAILGTYASSRCMVASEVAARKGILYFELGAIANAITQRGYKTVWRTCPTSLDFCRGQVNFITSWLAPTLGKKVNEMKVGIAHEDGEYGTSVANSFIALAKKTGLQIVSVEAYSNTSNDLSSVIFRLRKAAPDIVVAVSSSQDAILLSRQANELGLNIPIMGTGGGHSFQSFADGLGPQSNGVLNVDFTQYHVNTKYTPGLEEFVKLYQETFKSFPRAGSSLANFMGANVIFDILEKTGGSFDPEKIHKVAMAMDIQPGHTATGWGVKFDKEGQNVRAECLVTQWRDGKLVTVWPKKFAVMEPILVK